MSDGKRTAALAALVVLAALLPAAVPAAADGPTIIIDHDGERVTVANASQQVVSGTAALPVGTELVVRVRSTADTQPRFFRTENAVVTANGTWAVAFDFSGQHAGGTFAVTVQTENGTYSTEARGEIVPCEGDCTDPTPRNTPTPRPEQGRTATPTAEPEPRLSLIQQIVSVDRGNAAGIELDLRGADTATLVLGNEGASGYKLVATVTDGDDDGKVVVYFDTALAGRSGKAVSVSGGDSVTVRRETSLSSQLSAGAYDLSLYAGNGTSGEPTAVGTLVVQDVEGTATPVTTPTERPASSKAFGRAAVGVAASGAFLLAGAALAFVLLRG